MNPVALLTAAYTPLIGFADTLTADERREIGDKAACFPLFG
jgi:hypothetical protein